MCKLLAKKISEKNIEISETEIIENLQSRKYISKMIDFDNYGFFDVFDIFYVFDIFDMIDISH